MVQIVTKTRLPTKQGDFTMIGFSPFADGLEHVALVRGNLEGQVLTRIHSECLTGDVFGSQRCDCGEQLDMAMDKINAEGAGIVLYLRQEGRGIGLGNKLRAYALQDNGMDTVQANHALGFADDARDFNAAVEMLKVLNVSSVRLMTNNPRKVSALENAGMVVARVPLLTCVQADNADYLRTKAKKLGHLIAEAKKAS